MLRTFHSQASSPSEGFLDAGCIVVVIRRSGQKLFRQSKGLLRRGGQWSFGCVFFPFCHSRMFLSESRSKVTLVLDARPTSLRSRFDVNIETDLKSAGMTKRVFFGFFDQGVFDQPSASRIPYL